jgi:hypothetical protein
MAGQVGVLGLAAAIGGFATRINAVNSASLALGGLAYLPVKGSLYCSTSGSALFLSGFFFFPSIGRR